MDLGTPCAKVLSSISTASASIWVAFEDSQEVHRSAWVLNRRDDSGIQVPGSRLGSGEY